MTACLQLQRFQLSPCTKCKTQMYVKPTNASKSLETGAHMGECRRLQLKTNHVPQNSLRKTTQTWRKELKAQNHRRHAKTFLRKTKQTRRAGGPRHPALPQCVACTKRAESTKPLKNRASFETATTLSGGGEHDVYKKFSLTNPSLGSCTKPRCDSMEINPTHGALEALRPHASHFFPQKCLSEECCSMKRRAVLLWFGVRSIFAHG